MRPRRGATVLGAAYAGLLSCFERTSVPRCSPPARTPFLPPGNPVRRGALATAWAAGIAAALAAAALPAQAQFVSLTGFGDSYADTGAAPGGAFRLIRILSCPTPCRNPTCRFTGGTNFVDSLQSIYGLPAVTNYRDRRRAHRQHEHALPPGSPPATASRTNSSIRRQRNALHRSRPHRAVHRRQRFVGNRTSRGPNPIARSTASRAHPRRGSRRRRAAAGGGRRPQHRLAQHRQFEIDFPAAHRPDAGCRSPPTSATPGRTPITSRPSNCSRRWRSSGVRIFLFDFETCRRASPPIRASTASPAPTNARQVACRRSRPPRVGVQNSFWLLLRQLGPSHRRRHGADRDLHGEPDRRADHRGAAGQHRHQPRQAASHVRLGSPRRLRSFQVRGGSAMAMAYAMPTKARGRLRRKAGGRSTAMSITAAATSTGNFYAAGYDYDAIGGTVGVEYRLDPRLLLGGVFGYSSPTSASTSRTPTTTSIPISSPAMARSPAPTGSPTLSSPMAITTTLSTARA